MRLWTEVAENVKCETRSLTTGAVNFELSDKDVGEGAHEFCNYHTYLLPHKKSFYHTFLDFYRGPGKNAKQERWSASAAFGVHGDPMWVGGSSRCPTAPSEFDAAGPNCRRRLERIADSCEYSADG